MAKIWFGINRLLDPTRVYRLLREWWDEARDGDLDSLFVNKECFGVSSCTNLEVDLRAESDAVLLRTLIFLSQASWVTQEDSGTPAILQGGVLHGRLAQRL